MPQGDSKKTLKAQLVELRKAGKATELADADIAALELRAARIGTPPRVKAAVDVATARIRKDKAAHVAAKAARLDAHIKAVEARAELKNDPAIKEMLG